MPGASLLLSLALCKLGEPNDAGSEAPELTCEGFSNHVEKCFSQLLKSWVPFLEAHLADMFFSRGRAFQNLPL